MVALQLAKCKLEVTWMQDMQPPYLIHEIDKKAEELATAIFYAVRTGSFTNFYVVGPARSGKTTLMVQVAQRLLAMSVSVTTLPVNDEEVIVIYPGKQIPAEALKQPRNRCYLVGCVTPPPSSECEIIAVPKPSANELAKLITAIAGELDKQTLRTITTRVLHTKSPIGAAVKSAKIIKLKGNTNDDTINTVLTQCGMNSLSVYDEQEIRRLITEKVKGQDHIVSEISPLIADFLINHNTKPLTFLFTGPSGVGKTYMAKTIAEILNIPIFVESSNTMKGDHDVSRIIGAPPGYVGYAVKTPFIRFLTEHPSGGVILFDG
jgi:ATP-dependent Clp protease ATP-binding subunit ClpA